MFPRTKRIPDVTCNVWCYVVCNVAKRGVHGIKSVYVFNKRNAGKQSLWYTLIQISLEYTCAFIFVLCARTLLKHL